MLLDDASANHMYSTDEHVRQKRSRSVLCLPIVKQTKLVGALYLENNLTPGAFTPDRVAVLQLLASQAAISLENAALYTELQRSGLLQRLPMSAVSQTGSFGCRVASGEFYWSRKYTTSRIRSSVPASLDVAFERIHPDDRGSVQRTFEEADRGKKGLSIVNTRLSDAGRHIASTSTSSRGPARCRRKVLDFAGAVRHRRTERMRAEEALRQAQSDLARINRVTTMGELTASLAHEVSQPLTGIMTNANVCQRRLAGDNPDLGERGRRIPDYCGMLIVPPRSSTESARNSRRGR